MLTVGNYRKWVFVCISHPGIEKALPSVNPLHNYRENIIKNLLFISVRSIILREI